jgi:hypothetical protein
MFKGHETWEEIPKEEIRFNKYLDTQARILGYNDFELPKKKTPDPDIYPTFDS